MQSLAEQEEYDDGFLAEKLNRTYTISIYINEKSTTYNVAGYWDGGGDNNYIFLNGEELISIYGHDYKCNSLYTALKGYKADDRVLFAYLYNTVWDEHWVWRTVGLYGEITAFTDDLKDDVISLGATLGAAFTAFAVIMMMNFFSMLIAGKRKEIGILRALGARGGDVFAIFYIETLIISLIAFGLSVTAASAICNFLNGKNNITLVSIKMLVVNVPTVAALLAAAMIIAFLGSFLPIYKMARKKPVDVIRE